MCVELREEFQLREVELFWTFLPCSVVHVRFSKGVRRLVRDEMLSFRVEDQSFKERVVRNPFQATDGAFNRIDPFEERERDYGAVSVHFDFGFTKASSLYSSVKWVPQHLLYGSSVPFVPFRREILGNRPELFPFGTHFEGFQDDFRFFLDHHDVFYKLARFVEEPKVLVPERRLSHNPSFLEERFHFPFHVARSHLVVRLRHQERNAEHQGREYVGPVEELPTFRSVEPLDVLFVDELREIRGVDGVSGYPRRVVGDDVVESAFLTKRKHFFESFPFVFFLRALMVFDDDEIETVIRSQPFAVLPLGFDGNLLLVVPVGGFPKVDYGSRFLHFGRLTE